MDLLAALSTRLQEAMGGYQLEEEPPQTGVGMYRSDIKIKAVPKVLNGSTTACYDSLQWFTSHVCVKESET